MNDKSILFDNQTRLISMDIKNELRVCCLLLPKMSSIGSIYLYILICILILFGNIYIFYVYMCRLFMYLQINQTENICLFIGVR